MSSTSNLKNACLLRSSVGRGNLAISFSEFGQVNFCVKSCLTRSTRDALRLVEISFRFVISFQLVTCCVVLIQWNFALLVQFVSAMYQVVYEMKNIICGYSK